MHTFLWTLLAVVVGAIVGTTAGWLRMRDQSEPAPQTTQFGGVEAAAAAPAVTPLFADLAAAQTAATAASVAASGKAAVPTPAALGATVENAKNTGSSPASPVLIVPHGPGFFGELDLAAAGVASIPVYAGSMTRDGLAQPSAIAKSNKIGTLRGPLARVELLHFGFLRDAVPVALHVRSADGIEGLVLLRLQRKSAPDSVIAVRPLPFGQPTPE